MSCYVTHYLAWQNMHYVLKLTHLEIYFHKQDYFLTFLSLLSLGFDYQL